MDVDVESGKWIEWKVARFRISHYLHMATNDVARRKGVYVM